MYDPRKLYAAKTSGDGTYYEGTYGIAKGWYGPADLRSVERFRTIKKTYEMRELGTVEEGLLLFGLIEPDSEWQREFLRQKAAEFLARAAQEDLVEDLPEFSMDEENLSYDEMIGEMDAAGYNYVEIHGVRKRPKKAQLTDAFNAFLLEAIGV